MHKVLINRLGGLSLSRKHVVRLADRPDMTLDVYRGRKTTTQQQQQWLKVKVTIEGHEFELLILCPPLSYAGSRSRSQYAPWISSQAWKDIQYNSGDILTLVRDGWLHHGTLISSSQLKHFYFQYATQFRPFRPLIDGITAVESRQFASAFTL